MKLLLCGISILVLTLSPASADDFKGPAHLRDGAKCGMGVGAHEVFVVNDLKDKKVKVTIHISMRTQGPHGVFYGEDKKVYDLPPGGETKIGCTRGNFIPVCFYTYEIIDCETP